jgi:hypothetical protein
MVELNWKILDTIYFHLKNILNVENCLYLFYRFIVLNIKILRVVALGHGGTRGEDKH